MHRSPRLRRHWENVASHVIRARNRYFLLIDAILLSAATILAFVIRFEGWDWSPSTPDVALTYVALALPVKLTLLWAAGLYRRLWRYASIGDLERIVLGCCALGVCSALFGAAIVPGFKLADQRVPLSV